MPMKIDEPWQIIHEDKGRKYPGAEIACDNGCSMSNDADRAKRLVVLWNMTLGIPTSMLKKVKPQDIEKLAIRRISRNQPK